MRNNKVAKSLFSLSIVILLSVVMSVTAFATGEAQVPADDENIVEQTEAVTETIPLTEAVTEAPYTEWVEETQAQEVEPQTQSQEIIDELPQVESQDIVEPTKMVIPDIEVSDTSLLGGVIAWLCVAVGIAVIAGVLVSQRTRQVGGQNRDNNRR